MLLYESSAHFFLRKIYDNKRNFLNEYFNNNNKVKFHFLNLISYLKFLKEFQSV